MKMRFTTHQIEDIEALNDVLADMGEICQRENIISLERQDWQHCEEKMRNLKMLLPFLFQQEKTEIYYHYRRKCKRKKSEVHDNYIISDKGIVFFNAGLTRGFFSNQKVPCAYYTSVFDDLKSKCRIFAEGGKEQYSILKMQQADNVFENKTSGISFLSQQDNDCIWLVKDEKNSAVCIKEAGVVHLLRKFIWSEETAEYAEE